MTGLSRGQNQPWPHRVATVLVTGAEARAVLLGTEGRAVDDTAWLDTTTPARDGVQVDRAGAVRLDLDRVPPAVHRVLVVGTAITGTPVVRVLGTADVEQVTFEPGIPTVETVLVLVELYRRDGAWKVRAVGQGYAGGPAELAAVHGLRVPEVSPAPAAAPAAVPVQVGDPVARLAMILDDASRSTAASESSAAWAERRLHADLETVVGDPSLRMGPAGDAARATAQRSHDDLVARARDRHRADLRQLGAELADLEDTLPPALARWSAPAWTGSLPAAAGPPWALRLGDLGLAGDPAFRVPMVRALPLQPPLWVETDLGGDETARRMLAAACLRAALALPRPPRTTVVDLAPGAGRVWDGLDVVLVTDPGGASAVVQEHLAHLSVVSLAAETGDWEGLPPEHRPGRLLVVCDVPTGLDEAAVVGLQVLAVQGAQHGTSLLLSGSTAPGLDLPLLTDLHERSLRVPSAVGGDLVDRYAGVTWVFHPDPGPDDPEVAARVRAVLARWREAT